MTEPGTRKIFGGTALAIWLVVGPILALWAAGALFS